MTLGNAWSGLVRFWWIIALSALLGISVAAAYNATSTPVYSSAVTFFVSTEGDSSSSALQADEFAQGRINSYAQLLTSERVVEQLVDTANVDVSVSKATTMITATPSPDTVILDVTVTDADKAASLAIAGAVASDFPRIVTQIDESDTSKVSLAVISGPTLQPTPISPRYTLNELVGLIAGLALGIVVAILVGRKHTPIANSTQLEAVVGVPVRGEITNLRKLGRALSANTGGEGGEGRDFTIDRLVVELGLETRPGTDAQQVVAFAASRSGDGTTVISAAVAKTLATLGHTVVFVDANLHASMAGKGLNLPAVAGLSEVIAGTIDVDDALIESTTRNLRILPRGTVAGNGVALDVLSSPAFASTLDGLRARFDTVIIDSPALWPYADTSRIARNVDGLVLIVGRGRTTIQQLSDRLETLASASPLLIGAVLSQPTRRPWGRSRSIPVISATSTARPEPDDVQERQHDIPDAEAPGPESGRGDAGKAEKSKVKKRDPDPQTTLG